MQFVRLLHNLQGVFRAIGGDAQKWTEDESVTTSLGHKIPVDDCGIEMSLQSVSEMPYMHTIEDDCGIAMSFVGQEELPYMHTLEDDCGIEMGLISVEEITQ